MATEAPGNGVGTTLASSCLSGATILSLKSATGFTNAQYHILITDGTNYEIALATSISGATLSVTRAVEAYNGVQTAFSFASGSTVTVIPSVASVQALITQSTSSIVKVDAYGADPTGTNDSTAAFIATRKALGATGNIGLGVGTYKLGTLTTTTTSTSANIVTTCPATFTMASTTNFLNQAGTFAVAVGTGVAIISYAGVSGSTLTGCAYVGGGTGTLSSGATVTIEIGNFIRGQGMVGPGAYFTVLDYHGYGTCVNITDGSAFGGSSNAGPHSGYSVSGYSSHAGAVGFAFGNMTAARNVDISVNGFQGTASIGFNLKNVGSAWSEQGVWSGIRAVANTDNYVLDAGSHDYNYYDFLVVANANQNGLTIKNNASCVGTVIKFSGNFITGVGSNTGVGWIIGTSTSDTSSMIQCTFQVSCEADGTGVAHKSFTISQTGYGASLMGTGTFIWNGGSANFVANTNAGGIIGIGGYVSEPGLGLMNLNGDGASFIGGVGFAEDGNLTGNYAYTGMTIYAQFGSYQAFIMPNSTVAIAGFQGTNFVRDMNIFFASGGASSVVTWPANVKWTTAHTLSTTAGYVDRVHLIYLPSSGNWYGEVFLHYA